MQILEIEYRLIQCDGSEKPQALCDHLERVEQTGSSSALGKPDSFGFTAELDGKVIGHVLLLEQTLSLPEPGSVPIIELPVSSLREALGFEVREGFVQSFAVDREYRRQGVGSALQKLGIDACRRRGLYQMRSWSSLSAVDNYRLKMALGFSIVPGHYYVPRLGKWVAGCYFVYRL